MGYEIKYFYKEADDQLIGTYRDEILSRSCKIGKFNEEVSIETLAGKIISQLARRNILIVDIEIYEFTKKKISYKQTESGISIKNKKFSFEAGALVNDCEEDDDELSRILENKELLEKIKNKIGGITTTVSNNLCTTSTVGSAAKKTKILRYEIYDPDITKKIKNEQKGYKFTIGKKYPIFSEKVIQAEMGIINYNTKDDSGKEVDISSECFVVPPIGLSFSNETVQSDSGEINLWKNINLEENMPDIRAR